jgi:HSP20 family molecular chaperone IbpA
MSRRIDPTEWMWAHAHDLIVQAERMHRQFFRLGSAAQTSTVWEPPVDVLEDDDEVVIVVAMPGVPRERVELLHEPGTLIVRGDRPLPIEGSRQVIRHLEIPYGHFERRIAVPAERLEILPPDIRHGCLVVRLRKGVRLP